MLTAVRCRMEGTWHFCGRRLLNPSNMNDRTTLDLQYEKLCTSFPAFAHCSKETLAAVSAAWSNRLAASQARPDSGSEPQQQRQKRRYSGTAKDGTLNAQKRSDQAVEEVTPPCKRAYACACKPISLPRVISITQYLRVM